jgi:type I restriction-modification system DNA methylase subunit
MIDQYDLVQLLTASDQPPADQARWLADFSVDMGWRPSDQLQLPAAAEFSTTHLIVEHGLENTAVITFLRHPYRHANLHPSQQKYLLNASYNNLVDWHINIDFEGVSYVYNRYSPPDFYVVRKPISRSDIAKLRSSTFQALAAKHPAPDVPALDSALIATVSLWKRRLADEAAGVSNNNLSALFNAIIFIRAAEDNLKRKDVSKTQTYLLMDLLARDTRTANSLRPLLSAALETLHISELPASFIEWDTLEPFDSLDTLTLSELISDFYRNRYARYFEYDFALMSKHALSRIYEHYVSVLRLPYSPQVSLFPRLPEERLERSYGNVYTPEFIARFFARYLRKELSLRSFQRLNAVDPACGSGIFLRVLLELQSETLFDVRTTESLRRLFDGVLGIDIDINACNAAKLSLSLLSMVLTDELPRSLRIVNSDAIDYYLDHPELRGTADAVLVNPPFVNLEQQSPALKKRITEILGDYVEGRQDLYLAILKLALDLLKPDGLGLFVLPENFLKSKNANRMRALLAEKSWIRCLVDLSAVRVFEDVGVYVILLIFQRKSAYPALAPAATVVTCQDFVGQALESVLDDRSAESTFYTVFNTEQESFAGPNWNLAPPRTASVLRKYAHFETLQEVAKVRLGMITGLDDVFLVPSIDVERYDPRLFVPLLSDREMEAYRVPKSVKMAVFHPFHGLAPLSEDILSKQFPRTWEFLLQNRTKLEARRAVKSGQIPWWRPERPRQPKHLLLPKIVTPHLVLAPRFALDRQGRFAVSHAPYIVVEHNKDIVEGGIQERDLLLYLLAVLNSTAAFWYLSQRSHVYERGYSRLEVATLNQVRIPSFRLLAATLRSRILRLVEARLTASGDAALRIEGELDGLIADIYGLSDHERETVGIGLGT